MEVENENVRMVALKSRQGLLAVEAASLDLETAAPKKLLEAVKYERMVIRND
jgi:hypothetical protein